MVSNGRSLNRLGSGLLENRCLLEECSALFGEQKRPNCYTIMFISVYNFTIVGTDDIYVHAHVYVYMHLSRRKWYIVDTLMYTPNSS